MTEKCMEVIERWRKMSPAEFALRCVNHACWACKWFAVDWEEQIVFCKLFNVPLDQAGATCGCYKPLRARKALRVLVGYALKLLSEEVGEEEEVSPSAV